jgi:hypothetical protein
MLAIAFGDTVSMDDCAEMRSAFYLPRGSNPDNLQQSTDNSVDPSSRWNWAAYGAGLTRSTPNISLTQ